LRTTIIALVMFTLMLPPLAAAKPHSNTALHRQQARYHHADGYLKAIGNVARRTIYNPRPAVRRRWQAATRWLTSIRTDAQAKITALRAPPLPPHHMLWMCIHGHEAADWQNHDTGHNGHYNGLQMHWNWGYGISGDPSRYTQSQIEQAAERGYRASGFSRGWLYGQWAHPDCLKYA
jgi:hypothetical protein